MASEIDNDAVSFMLLRLEKMKFSKNFASKLIGRERLERCVSNGEIRRDRTNITQHGKWFCNAADVMRKLLTM